MNYPPISTITAPTVSTDQAAYYLNRKPETLRKYAKMDKPPIRPLRLGRQYLFRTADIKAIIGEAA